MATTAAIISRILDKRADEYVDGKHLGIEPGWTKTTRPLEELAMLRAVKTARSMTANAAPPAAEKCCLGLRLASGLHACWSTENLRPDA